MYQRPDMNGVSGSMAEKWEPYTYRATKGRTGRQKTNRRESVSFGQSLEDFNILVVQPEKDRGNHGHGDQDVDDYVSHRQNSLSAIRASAS